MAQTAQLLREGLQAGQWREHLPGERELCERFHVSRPTVRGALEQLRREGWLDVAHGKRRRILAPRPHRTARDPWSKTIGLLSAEPLRNLPPFIVCWVDELRTHLSREGFELEFHASRKCLSPRPARALAALLANAPAAAWVLLLCPGQTQRWFAAQELPCVVAGTCASGIELPSFDVDHRALGRHAGALLWRKGHRHAALLLPGYYCGGDAETEAGFCEGFTAGTRDPGAALVLQHDGTVAGVTSRLDAVLRRPQPVSALLVSRTEHVLTVVTHLLRQGLRIPEDVAVISRDNDAFLEFLAPAMTRYVGAPGVYARRLSRAVVQLAQTGALPVRPVRLTPRFIAGETV